ncbi:hypothetical protein ACQ4PT_020306 [Festuca glaucescens]
MAPLGLAGASSYHELCCYGAGIAGNIFAFVLFVSPLPTFRRIVRNGSTEQFSAMPYIYSLLNCLICVWYALPVVSYGVALVATVNTIGAAFQLAYTAVFIAYADAKKRLKVSMLLLGVFCAFGLIVYVSMAMFDHKPRQIFVGYLSVASLICMFASPLSSINLVIKTKSVEYMPFYLSLSMSLMSASFFAYGVLLDDFFIYVRSTFLLRVVALMSNIMCNLVPSFLLVCTIADSERDWHCLGGHTVAAICLLQKRIERRSHTAITSHTYMSMQEKKRWMVHRACTVIAVSLPAAVATRVQKRNLTCLW